MLYEQYTHTRIGNIPVVYIEVALIVTLLFSYVGLAFHTVYAAGMKERAERTLSTLSTQIGTIENSYLQLTKQITIERAHELGFRENLEDTVFLNTNGKVTAALPSGNGL